MTTTKRALVVALLGLVSCAAWLGEIFELKGWSGSLWLDSYPWASLIGAACVAGSVMVAAVGPSPVRSASKRPRRTLFFALTAIGSLAFWLARAGIYLLFSRGAAIASLAADNQWDRHVTAVALGFIVSAALITALGFTAALRRWLTRVPWSTALLLLAALFLVMPLGTMTIHVIPSFNGHTDVFQVVKMGYPTFWTNVLLALATWLTGARKVES